MDPFISVIVPTKDRLAEVTKCISSVYKSINNHKMCSVEVILIDDHSKQPIHTLAIKFPKLKIVKTEMSGNAGARNTGIEHARGEVIAFTDSDCEVAENWIESIYNHYKKHKNCFAAQGIPWLFLGNYSYLTKCDAASVKSVVDFQIKGKTIRTIETRNLTIRKKLLKRMGTNKLFREELPSMVDREAAKRILHITKICWDPHIVAKHRPPTSLVDTMRHKFWYGRGMAYFNLKEDCDGGSIIKNYIIHPTLEGVPIWWVFLRTLMFTLGYYYERITNREKVRGYRKKYHEKGY